MPRVPDGVATKTAAGWVDGRFESKRDDNGATVSVVPTSKNAFYWLIEAADHSYTIKEVCAR
jgi:hypothetical protein